MIISTKRTEDRCPPSRDDLALEKVNIARREENSVIKSPEAFLGRSMGPYWAPRKMQKCKRPRHFYWNTDRAFYSTPHCQVTRRNIYLKHKVQWRAIGKPIDILTCMGLEAGS